MNAFPSAEATARPTTVRQASYCPGMAHDASAAAILAWLDQEDRHVTEIIRRHGCFLQYVLADEGQPPFTYTVGLFGLGHPELIVFGLDARSSASVLNTFYDRVRNGSDLTPGEVVTPWGGSVAFLVEEFPDAGSTLLAANRHYQRPAEASVPAYRLNWTLDGGFTR